MDVFDKMQKCLKMIESENDESHGQILYNSYKPIIRYDVLSNVAKLPKNYDPERFVEMILSLYSLNQHYIKETHQGMKVCNTPITRKEFGAQVRNLIKENKFGKYFSRQHIMHKKSDDLVRLNLEICNSNALYDRIIKEMEKEFTSKSVLLRLYYTIPQKTIVPFNDSLVHYLEENTPFRL